MKTINYKINELLNPNNYKLFVCDEFLDSKFYEELRSDIMEVITRNLDSWDHALSANSDNAPKQYRTFGGGYDGDSVDKFKSLFKEYDRSERLFKLIDELNSKKFANYIFSTLNLNSKNKLKIVESSYTLNLYDYLFKECIYLNLKLSSYPPQSGIALHRDNKRKKVGMLLYFGFSDNIEREYGGTQFYSDHKAPPNWSNEQVDHSFIESENLELFLDKKPYGNSFAAFEISNHSWHGVNPYSNDNKNLYRINLQINFMRVSKFTFIVKLIKYVFTQKK
jgi:hypothetical protein